MSNSEMGSCIIHAGMHKTGSTSIQKSLYGLNDERFLYAKLGEDANHTLAMYSLFSDDPKVHSYHRIKEAQREKIEKDLYKSIEEANGRTLILSGEGISTLKPIELTKLKKYLNKYFRNLIVVLYIRPQSGYISSAFQERLKHNFIGFHPEREYRNYKNCIDNFDTVFGQEDVLLFKFDRNHFPEGCVVQDFCKRLNITFPANRIVNANESFSLQSVKWLYIYRKFGDRFHVNQLSPPEFQRLGNFLKSTGNDAFSFSPELLSPILKKHTADIEWMEKRLDQTLRENLGEHKEGQIRSEEDLLTPSQEMVDSLMKLFGDKSNLAREKLSLREVALLIHILRLQILDPASSILNKSKINRTYDILNTSKKIFSLFK